MWFWQKNRQITEYAKTVADEFYSQVQGDMLEAYLGENEEPGKALSSLKKKQRHKALQREVFQTQQVQQQLDALLQKIRQFKVEHRLGVYGKARLHLVFCERLKELGYEPELVNQLNRMVLLRTA